MTDYTTTNLPLTVLIVDDEPLAVERLSAICRTIANVAVVGTAADGREALAQIAALTPDVVLLDLTMPEMDGMSAARAIQTGVGSDTGRPAIIFVTAHADFAVEAFEVEAVDYLLKPVAADRLKLALTRVSERTRRVGGPANDWVDELWVPNRGELIRIDADTISRIDAERDYVRLHVQGRTFLLLQTIAGLERRLDPQAFVRIHRSTIVRRDTVRGLRHDGQGVWSVEFAGDAEGAAGEILRIGRTYLPAVKAMAGR